MPHPAKTIVATWLLGNEAYILEASGTLLRTTREHDWEMWSPPEVVGVFSEGTERFEQLLRDRFGEDD